MAKRLGIIQPDHSMDAVISHLRQLGIVFERHQTTIDTAALPPDLVKAIKALPKGEPFVLPQADEITVNVLIGY